MRFRLVVLGGMAGFLLMAGCGSDDSSSSLEDAVHKGAEHYGYTDQYSECIAKETKSNGKKISGEDAAGRRKLAEGLADRCFKKASGVIVVADPTMAQADAVIALFQPKLTAQIMVNGYLSRKDARCAFDKLRSKLTPTQVATLINDRGPQYKTVRHLVEKSEVFCVV